VGEGGTGREPLQGTGVGNGTETFGFSKRSSSSSLDDMSSRSTVSLSQSLPANLHGAVTKGVRVFEQ
jgi:hypothetical protein